MLKKLNLFIIFSLLIMLLLSSIPFFIFYHKYAPFALYDIKSKSILILYAITNLILIMIVFFAIMLENKKVIPLNNWLHDFVNNHQEEYHYNQKYFQSYTMKYCLFFYTYLLCEMMVFHLYFYVTIFFDYSFTFLTILVILGCFIIRIIYTIVINKFKQKYYLSHLYSHNPLIYLFITYDLSSLRFAKNYFLNINDYLNVSAALSRALYCEEGYEYIQLWKQSLKKCPPLYQLLYIEHCLSYLLLLKRNNEFESCYHNYQLTFQKYPKYHKNKLVQQLSYLVSLYYAFYMKDWTKVIELENNYSKYVHSPSDFCIYIFYSAYSHLDEKKAQEIFLKHPNNIFIKGL